MSLLLQALQKASRNREANPDTPEAPSTQTDADASLSLEPLAEPQLSSDSATHFDDNAQPVSERPDDGLSSPADAADVMRANEAPGYSPLDWVRDHHMLAFLAAAALFAIFYGLYVYLQISNPGLFRSQPPPIAAPMQTAVAPTIAANEPPPVSGMPDAQRSTTMPAQAGSSTAPDPGLESNATPASPEPDTGSAAEIDFVAVAEPATRPSPQKPSATQPRTQRAAPVARVATTTDSDGVEVVEIPASPSVAVLPQQEKTRGQTDIAVENREADPSSIDPGLMAAYEALQQGDYEKAGTLYGKVLVRSPDNADAMLGLAAISWKQGRPNVASGYYGRVLERDPRNTHAQAGLIAILGSADPVAAETKLKQLIGREPSGFLYFTLGNLYAEQGLWSQAQYAYFQAYQLNPDNPDYAFNLAVGLEHLGQSRPALDHYRRALDLSFRKGRANFDQELAIERVGQLSARIK
ncbi:MAG TPA: tetratricopeptide repeat protein [Burkholderiales bacterium]|nr:tetratricopeptide repeat protein [Burkholderiales bacterium]